MLSILWTSQWSFVALQWLSLLEQIPGHILTAAKILYTFFFYPPPPHSLLPAPNSCGYFAQTVGLTHSSATTTATAESDSLRVNHYYTLLSDFCLSEELAVTASKHGTSITWGSSSSGEQPQTSILWLLLELDLVLVVNVSWVTEVGLFPLNGFDHVSEWIVSFC